MFLYSTLPKILLSEVRLLWRYWLQVLDLNQIREAWLWAVEDENLFQMAAEVHKAVIWKVWDFFFVGICITVAGLNVWSWRKSVFVIPWNASSDGKCVFGVAQWCTENIPPGRMFLQHSASFYLSHYICWFPLCCLISSFIEQGLFPFWFKHWSYERIGLAIPVFIPAKEKKICANVLVKLDMKKRLFAVQCLVFGPLLGWWKWVI